MKKSLFFYAMAACVAISNVSCGGDDDNSGLPPAGTVITLPEPATASQAAAYVFETSTANAVKSETDDNVLLKGINFTESGKAIIEVLANGAAKFVTCNATLANGEYTLTDDSGKKIGTVTEHSVRGTTTGSIDIQITITIPGVGVVTFSPTSPAAVQKVVETIAATTATTNICRTWTVVQMNITLDGDVDLVMTESSGNLKRFADEAQKQGANLTDNELAQLNKTFKGISLDKNGLFSIEYYENSDKTISSEACSWSWTDEAAQKLRLRMRDGSDFGNKFLSDNTVIKADFNPVGATFTLNTEIKGSKNYVATLTIVLK